MRAGFLGDKMSVEWQFLSWMCISRISEEKFKLRNQQEKLSSPLY